MIVRELTAVMNIKSDRQSFQRAESGMSRLVGFAKAAAAAFASFKLAQWAKNAADQVANLGDKFDKMALRTGETATELQGLSHAAELSGTDLGTMEAGIRRLQNATLEAAEGNQRYRDEFKRLGIDVKNTDGTLKSFTQLLPEMADGLNKLATDTEKSAVAQRLMGRSGTRALPLLKQGSEAIREMITEVEDLGAVLDKDLIQTSTKYIDNQARVALINQSVRNSIARGLLPAFIKMQEGVLKWWKANQEWIRGGLEKAFTNIGRIVSNVGSFFGMLTEKVVNLVNSLDPATKKILAIGTAAAVVAALLALPGGSILLMIGLIGLLIDDFETWRKGGKSAIGEIIKAFEEFFGIDIKKKDLTDALEGLAMFVVDAGKDSSKAWEDLWESTLLVLEGYFGTFWDWVTSESGTYWGPVIKNQVNSFTNWLSNSLGTYWGPLFRKGADDFNSGIIEPIKRKWEEFEVWLMDLLKDIGKDFAKFGTDLGRDLLSPITDLFSDAEEDRPRQRVSMRRRPVTPSLAMAGATAGAIVNNPTTTVNNTVNAAPGMDEAALAAEVARQTTEAFEKQNREAMRAFSTRNSG